MPQSVDFAEKFCARLGVRSNSSEPGRARSGDSSSGSNPIGTNGKGVVFHRCGKLVGNSRAERNDKSK